MIPISLYTQIFFQSEEAIDRLKFVKLHGAISRSCPPMPYPSRDVQPLAHRIPAADGVAGPRSSVGDRDRVGLEPAVLWRASGERLRHRSVGCAVATSR